jgi:aspartokinase
MSGVTDLLLKTLLYAESGDEPAIAANLKELRARHVEACKELVEGAQCESAIAEINALIGDFGRVANGIRMMRERPSRSVDEAMAIGERISALLSEYLGAIGVSCRVDQRIERDHNRRCIRKCHAHHARDPSEGPTGPLAVAAAR